ncbi:MAG TPA: class I SAM-dependent methyltransferase [Flavisolibacter sp.]
MLKKIFMMWIRRLGLMQAFDRVFFLFNKARFSSKNKRFRKENPLIKLPPDYMLYEAYRLDYENYYNDGRNTAEWIREQLSPFITPGPKKILEWGCGPARIIRHLPAQFPASNIHGTDYNINTIAWCQANIPNVQFSINAVNPPLPYNDGLFDIVYALSVFTHLSGENHSLWINEMHRILKPGSVFLLTTQGEAFLSKLDSRERKEFNAGRLVTREQVKEGHRSFSAFHPQNFMHSLFGNKWKVLKHEPGIIHHYGPEQDVWIIQKT